MEMFVETSAAELTAFVSAEAIVVVRTTAKSANQRCHNSRLIRRKSFRAFGQLPSLFAKKVVFHLNETWFVSVQSAGSMLPFEKCQQTLSVENKKSPEVKCCGHQNGHQTDRKRYNRIRANLLV